MRKLRENKHRFHGERPREGAGRPVVGPYRGGGAGGLVEPYPKSETRDVSLLPIAS